MKNPPADQVNFIYDGDEVLRTRIETYCRRFPGLKITVSPLPLPSQQVSLYVIEIARIEEVAPEVSSYAAPVLCYGPPEELSAAWEAGCADYLKEPWTIHELHFRIERLLSGSGGTTNAGQIEIRETEMFCGSNRDDLTAQEGKILSLLLRNFGSTVPRDALYYTIWGRNGTGSRVADMHISKLRKKLMNLQKDIPPGERVEIVSMRKEGYAIR